MTRTRSRGGGHGRQVGSAPHGPADIWATPDTPGAARDAVWRELVAAGVDVLNTDDLAGLQAFLLDEDPAETA